jgi:predicted RNase H-like nuclease (RuvC/YqgF family)
MGAVTWRKTGVYVLLVLPILGLAGIAVAAKHQDASQQSGDPVADAARKAREQKKNAAQPKKVFTNDDVAPAPAPAPPATAPTEAKEGDANAPKKDAAADAKDEKAPDNSEAGWRKRFAEQRAKISQAEQELDVLQREAQKLQTQYYSDPQKALAEQYTRKDITDQDAKIQAKKDEIAKLKQGLSDMEDQLRASGGDSGWAR